PEDARVASLEERPSGVATLVENLGPTRRLTIVQGELSEVHDIAPGTWTIHTSAPSATNITATLDPGDRWPENDVASLVTTPLASAEKWWIGSSAPPPGRGWRGMGPGELPDDPLAYLAP